MTTVNINNTEYDFETFSEDAKAQFISLQFADQEIAQLQARLAAMQTARIAYANALNAALPKEGEKKSQH